MILPPNTFSISPVCKVQKNQNTGETDG